MSVNEKMTAIADAIRGKTGGTKKLGLDAMAAGVGEVYEAGKQAEYDRFWNAYQSNGDRFNYYQAFTHIGWNDTTFKPKYPINCYGTQSYHITNATDIFTNTYVSRIDVPVIVTGLPMTQTFYNCRNLETIVLLRCEGVTEFKNTFANSAKIKNITIDGSIDVNFNISATPVLTNESVQSIIDHLADLTGKTAQKLTLHTDVGAKLTQAQKDAISAKNWTLVY